MGSATFEGFHLFAKHADWVTMSTGLRSNFVFDADLVSGNVRITLNKTTATSYEVRNYDGDVIASGATSGATLDIPDAALEWRGRGPYGWYRVYLFGPSQANWGTAYGDMTFYRVSDAVTAAAFPENPAVAINEPGEDGNEEIARGVMGLGPARVQASLADISPYGTTVYGTASGTSVAVVAGGIGNGIRVVVFHVFEGDASELATPTQSGGVVTWTLENRTTSGALTVSAWSGSVSGGTFPGTVTFSSGTKSGVHWVYLMNMLGSDFAASRTPATATGTGTTATINTADQGFPTGRQKGVFAVVATSAGVTFSPWSAPMRTDAWPWTPLGDQPTAPNSRISVATGIYLDDTAETLTATWSTSCDYVAVALPVCAAASAGFPISSLEATGDYWIDHEVAGRDRKSLILFANGLNQRFDLVPNALDNICPYGVVWSPFNEPNLYMEMSTYISRDLQPFYDAVKAHDPTAKVLGWSSVSYNAARLSSLQQFIDADGLDYCDDIDLHSYNTSNGDLALTRRTLETTIGMLSDAGFTGDLWQTEQGFPWEHMGQTWPRFAGRWNALHFFVLELYGIPVERNHYWYDQPHGFPTFPTWWTSVTGPGPQALPVRTMVDEIGARTLAAQLEFDDARNHYAGGVWVGADGSKTVGVMAGSFGLPPVRLATSAASLVVVDCWGNAATLSAAGGIVTLPASEMPVWVRVPTGVTCGLISSDWDWGPNRSVPAAASTDVASSSVSLSRINDGVYQNQYDNGSGSLSNALAPWSDAATTTSVPKSVTIDYPNFVVVARVLIDCVPPWQLLGAPLDFDVEVYTTDGEWVEVYSFSKPASTSFAFISQGGCRAETFWSQQSTWIVELDAPVVAKKLRVTFNEVSEGPHESDVWCNNGQAANGQKRLTIREIQTFGSPKRTFLLGGLPA